VKPIEWFYCQLASFLIGTFKLPNWLNLFFPTRHFSTFCSVATIRFEIRGKTVNLYFLFITVMQDIEMLRFPAVIYADNTDIWVYVLLYSADVKGTPARMWLILHIHIYTNMKLMRTQYSTNRRTQYSTNSPQHPDFDKGNSLLSSFWIPVCNQMSFCDISY
jgi:hypothetical protein